MVETRTAMKDNNQLSFADDLGVYSHTVDCEICLHDVDRKIPSVSFVGHKGSLFHNSLCSDERIVAVLVEVLCIWVKAVNADKC